LLNSSSTTTGVPIGTKPKITHCVDDAAVIEAGPRNLGYSGLLTS
jgi:hypothetical protein